MTYTIIEKMQQAIPTVFGGGTRFRFRLTVFYPNGTTRTSYANAASTSEDIPAGVDNLTSDMTVDLGTFVAFEIGDKINLNVVTAHE